MRNLTAMYFKILFYPLFGVMFVYPLQSHSAIDPVTAGAIANESKNLLKELPKAWRWTNKEVRKARQRGQSSAELTDIIPTVDNGAIFNGEVNCGFRTDTKNNRRFVREVKLYYFDKLLDHRSYSNDQAERSRNVQFEVKNIIPQSTVEAALAGNRKELPVEFVLWAKCDTYHLRKRKFRGRHPAFPKDTQRVSIVLPDIKQKIAKQKKEQVTKQKTARRSNPKPNASKPPSQKKRNKTAKTSKKTNATHASQQDIKKQLDKKTKTTNTKRTKPKSHKAEIRYRALLNSGNRERKISPPKKLADFFAYGENLSVKKGYRLVDFEVIRMPGERLYVGLWEKGSGTNILSSPMSISDFNKFMAKQNEKGLMLADFELFGKGDKRRVVGLWRSGNIAEKFSPSMSIKGFMGRNANLKEEGFYPVDIEVRKEDGQFRYAALWRRIQPSELGSSFWYQNKPTQFMLPLEANEFRKTRDQLVSKGQKMIDIERFVINDENYFVGLWIEEQGKSRISKPRDYKTFKDFVKALDNSYIEDLEAHRKTD